MRQAVSTNAASVGSGPYSQAIISGDFVFVSGQGPLDPVTDIIVEGTIEQQTELTLQNVSHILEAAGCTMDDVVKVNVFLATLKDFDAFNSVYTTFFSQPMPARSCIGAELDGILVEIDVIARIPAVEK
ncbi:Rid family detoxifying hydrolase [Paenibacillus eucommiae]|uniref:2-iminobutanoate/2-iminopropanoate deaminase n=1 Tax=Paenibacillus eucommiae TaxID=1355755 RepID=A0ABS4JDS3_9BACL|nr:Rid family detoxifying hydrolase [Paenibacillus eucommiae]MBP1996869.1 2-iminobutanoate/2-iminopropanoate deaminase [Paenibacillus eucommiae]